MVLNVVLKSTHQQQAAKVSPRKAIVQITPLCVVSIS